MLVLQCCPPHKAAKTFRLLSDGRWIKLSDYDAGTWFSVQELEPESLEDMPILLLFSGRSLRAMSCADA